MNELLPLGQGGLRMERRSFLTGAAALGAGALILPRVARAQARRGGTLRIGLSGGNSNDSLDPLTYKALPNYVLGMTVGNCLVELDPKSNPIPELAESWEASDDATRWVFRIREGVTFHDGRPLTAADVVWSLSRHIGPGTTSPVKALLADVTEIRADGGGAVIVQLSASNADLDVIMSQWHLIIVPEGTTDFMAFNGTGPYVLESFEPGVRLTATRNPNYWKADRAWVDGVEIVFIDDGATRVNALMSGEVHAINQVEQRVVSRLRDRGGIAVIEGIGTKYFSMAMNASADPFLNNEVRLAFKYGMPRAEIVASTLSGFGMVGNDHPVPPNSPWLNTGLEQYAYDPERATFHLAKAGFTRLPVDLHSSTMIYPGATDASVIMQERMAAAGFDLVLHNEPAEGYWSNVWRAKPLVMSRWAVRPTPAMMFGLAYTCASRESGWNEAYWCNERFDALLAEARITTDPSRRRELYWELQAIHYAEGGSSIFAFPSTLDAYAEAVGGVEPDSVQELFGCRVAERVWLSA